MKGKLSRLFVGDKEVIKVKSWAVKGFTVPDNEELSFDNRLPEQGTINFKGKYDPDEDFVTDKFNRSNPFVVNMYLPNGEVMKDVLVKATVQEGEITIEPVEREAQEQIKKAWLGI